MIFLFLNQLRLNVERLKSDRGVHTLEKYCGDLKFHGKGYERHDLNNVMKRLEHWAHRLHPNFRFDDFITQVEKLGKKKEMQTHMYRYRHGMLQDVVTNAEENVAEEEGNVDEASHTGGFEPIDELDEIIDQQIQNYTLISTAPRTPAHDRTFDSIRSSVIATPRLREQYPVEASTPIANKQTNNVIVETNETAPTLTSDQMAKIAENRRLAQERLKQKRLEAAAKVASEESHIEDNMEI